MLRYGYLDCEWRLLSEGQWTCSVCSIPYSLKVRRATTPPPRNCASKMSGRIRRFVCQHIGDEVGKVDCPSCSGTVRIKTFACAIHERATLSKKLDGIACCQGCPDYSPSKRDEDPDNGRNA